MTMPIRRPYDQVQTPRLQNESRDQILHFGFSSPIDLFGRTLQFQGLTLRRSDASLPYMGWHEVGATPASSLNAGVT